MIDRCIRSLRIMAAFWLVTGTAWVGSFAEEELFPAELVKWTDYPGNPVFTAGGAGEWDARIRERGWIIRENDRYHLWYTGYDGTKSGLKMLGYATSSDGLSWQRCACNPVYREHWTEDMMVVKQGDTYYMFAEGLRDQAQLLTSRDGIHWKRQGQLDIRLKSGEPIPAGPFGTPTAWYENGTWYLFYERRDAGVWLATSRDLKTWVNVQDEPVLVPGPAAHEKDLIALNQIVRYRDRYFALYHGTAHEPEPNLWTTNIATSTDLIHWRKYAHNPLLPVESNKSSGILVHDGKQFRLYTMHNEVHVHFPD